MKNLYIYCICRITKYWKTINQDLVCKGYKNVKAYVPTVSILKSSRAGKDTYDEVPLLFNYGFIRMSTKKAYDRQYLRKLKRDIPGIMGWLYSLETMHNRKKRIRIDESELFDDFSMVASISKKQFKYYKELSKRNHIYSANDIVGLKIGDYITLRRYPFDGIGAIIEEVNLLTKEVTVKIFPGKNSLVLSLPIDNILYSIYSDYDEDKLKTSNIEFDINQIPDNAVDELLTLKQF